MINNCTKIIEKFLKEIQNNIFENDKNSKSKYKIENLKDLYLNKKLEINFLNDSKIYNTNDKTFHNFVINDSTKFKTKDLVKLFGALIGGIQYHLNTERNLEDFKEKVDALNTFLNKIELKNSNNNTFKIAYYYNSLDSSEYLLRSIPKEFKSDLGDAWIERYKKEGGGNFKIYNANHLSKSNGDSLRI